MTRYEEMFMCPFCRSRAMGPHDMCGGSFTDRAHPSAVRPIFVEVDVNGFPLSEHVERLNEAKATYNQENAS